MNDRIDGTDDLTASTWVFETVAGEPLPDRARVSMSFDVDAGRVFGSAGCNRYHGGYSLEGDRLTIGRAATTLMACPDALMRLEDRFLDTLGNELAVVIDPETGRLELTGPDGSRSTAYPAESADD